jgi:hypothetical protein
MLSRYHLEELLQSIDGQGLLILFSQRWFNDLIPGAKLMLGCSQGKTKHLEGDVAVHTSLVFDNIKTASVNRLSRKANYLELLSAIIHDFRKPACQKILEDNQVTFPNHEELAAKELINIYTNLFLTKEELEQLYFVIFNHGLVHNWPRLSKDQKSGLVSSDWITHLALLQEADAKSCYLFDGTHLPVYWESMVSKN